MASNNISLSLQNQKISVNIFTTNFKYFNITTIITESNPLKIAATSEILNAAAYFQYPKISMIEKEFLETNTSWKIIYTVGLRTEIRSITKFIIYLF